MELECTDLYFQVLCLNHHAIHLLTNVHIGISTLSMAEGWVSVNEIVLGIALMGNLFVVRQLTF